ncbi:MAG: amidohydrolase family protein, partial [Bacteroidota bacterium]
ACSARRSFVGSSRRQQEIFEILCDSYPEYPKARFVVLTLDMEYMGAGQSISNYRTQLDEVADLKLLFPEQLLPFISVDPRRPDILDWVKYYVEQRGFVGIKLYPPLGYFPFDKRLLPIYEYAVQHDLPVLTHCDIGGIYYRGEISDEHLRPESFIPGHKPEYKRLRNKDFKDHFTNPENYIPILKHKGLENLKLCMAHLGGIEMIKGLVTSSDTRIDWHRAVLDLLKYKNVYADISFSLHDNDVWGKLKADIQDTLYREKILFGTDFYMTVRHVEEIQLVENFRKKTGITIEDWQQIAFENPRNFIRSTFYTP